MSVNAGAAGAAGFAGSSAAAAVTHAIIPVAAMAAAAAMSCFFNNYASLCEYLTCVAAPVALPLGAAALG